METEIKSVARQLDSSVESQQTIVESIISIKETTAVQFNRISSHLVTAGENVNHLTDAVADIRNEMTRLSVIMQELATRQSERTPPAPTISPTSAMQDPAISDFNQVSDQPTGPPRSVQNHRSTSPATNPNFGALTDAQREAIRSPLPDSSENSVASHTSNTTHSSERTQVSANSDQSNASSKVKSPPPKRTRQSAITHTPPRGFNDAAMAVEPEAFPDDNVFHDDTAIFDAVLHDALRTNLESRFHDSVASPTGAPTNSAAANPQGSTVFSIDDDSVMSQSSGVSPPLSDQLDVISQPPSMQHITTLAPLNPRNNNYTDSAGATNE